MQIHLISQLDTHKDMNLHLYNTYPNIQNPLAPMYLLLICIFILRFHFSFPWKIPSLSNAKDFRNQVLFVNWMDVSIDGV